jgi:hypothetical protein
MEIRKILAIFSCLVFACLVLSPAARADEYDQMTKLVFSQPVEIPGRVLPAGSYWFVLENSNASRDIVQIFAGDWSKLDVTLLTVPTTREQVTDKTEVKFAERPHDQPQALLDWYYPGRTVGHEFVYSPRREREFARDMTHNLITRTLG